VDKDGEEGVVGILAAAGGCGLFNRITSLSCATTYFLVCQ